jgi:hypothetical protein
MGKENSEAKVALKAKLDNHLDVKATNKQVLDHLDSVAIELQGSNQFILPNPTDLGQISLSQVGFDQ